MLAASRILLANVSGLLRAVGAASLGQLAAMRGEVSAATAAATELASEASSSSANGTAANANLSPAQRARAAIEALHRDIFENRVLDPYLQFASPEEEEAYRERERERKQEIDRALALGTPEGLRRAADVTQEQLRDAGEHGADRSPDFAGMMSQIGSAKESINAPTTASQAQAQLPHPPSSEVADIAATLRAAGLSSDVAAHDGSGHGLNFDRLAAVAGRTNEGLG